MSNAGQLGVLGGLATEGRGGNGTIDELSVVSVLGIRNSVLNQSILVGNTTRLSEVDHSIGVVLLGTRVCVSKESLSAVDAAESVANIGGMDGTVALHAEIMPALSKGGKIGLRCALLLDRGEIRSQVKAFVLVDAGSRGLHSLVAD